MQMSPCNTLSRCGNLLKACSHKHKHTQITYRTLEADLKVA